MTAIHVTIDILLILALIAGARLAGLVLDGRRQRCWTDDDIAPPDWINHSRDDR